MGDEQDDFEGLEITAFQLCLNLLKMGGFESGSAQVADPDDARTKWMKKLPDSSITFEVTINGLAFTTSLPLQDLM